MYDNRRRQLMNEVDEMLSESVAKDEVLDLIKTFIDEVEDRLIDIASTLSNIDIDSLVIIPDARDSITDLAKSIY